MSDESVFESAENTYQELCRLFDEQVGKIQQAFEEFKDQSAETWNGRKAHGYYPVLRIEVEEDQLNLDPSLSHGAFVEEGLYEMVLTNPRQYHNLLEQFEKLKDNCPEIEFKTGLSNDEIPLHYAMRDLHFDLSSALGHDETKIRLAKRAFTKREPLKQNYDYAAGKHQPKEDVYPLYGYGAARVDHAINQFFYYTRTPWEALQPFVIFSNYAQYVDGVEEYAKEQLKMDFNEKAGVENTSNTIAVIRTGHSVQVREGFEEHPHLSGIKKAVEKGSEKGAQMPACHIVTSDGLGTSMINTGVGDANCMNISNLIAPKRSHAWLMAGHCAGLSPTMNIGDYVFSDAYYINHGGTMDIKTGLPQMEPVMLSASSEIQRSISDTLHGMHEKNPDFDPSRRYRRAPVVSTNDRNWENDPNFKKALDKTYAAALEMETSFLAKQARVHSTSFASFLKVSDMPGYDRPKTAAATDDFFAAVDQHLGIILTSIEHVKENYLHKMHSRKFRAVSPSAGSYVLQ